jgi:hypothetical protein
MVALSKPHLLLAALLLAAACSEPAPRTDSSVTDTIDTAAGCRQFAREGLKLKARTRADLAAEVGRPINTTVTVESNRHVPGVQDSIFRLEYDGMTVQVRKAGAGNELLEQVAVSKRKWLNFPFFQPGVPVEKLVQAIGEPQRREGDRLIYTCAGGEAEDPVVFATNSGVVERIVFNYYVD